MSNYYDANIHFVNKDLLFAAKYNVCYRQTMANSNVNCNNEIQRFCILALALIIVIKWCYI